MPKLSKTAKYSIYTFLLVVCSASAYQMGSLWSSKKTSSEEADVTTVQKSENAPKTIDFSLKGGVVNIKDLPELKLKDTNDELRSLADWKGKLILLNFWATWCPPCRFEIPEFIEYQKKYEKDGLQIIGIGIDEEKPVKNFVRTLEINYPVLITQDSSIMDDWGNATQILPYSVLINRDGRIIYIHRGQLSKLSFKYEIEPFIQETKTAGK